MPEELGNTQTAPVTPASAGTPDDTQAKLAELERKSEGLLRDLQAERAKRQELEAKLVTPPAASSPATQPDANLAELANLINPVVAPQIQRIEQQLHAEKAKNFLASKTGKSWDELESDKSFQDKLDSTIRRYGLSGNLHDVAVRAYDLMKRDEELATYKAKEAEAARASSSMTTLPAGAPPAPSKSATEYDLDTWNRVGSKVWAEHQHDSVIKKVGDKIVVTPK